MTAMVLLSEWMKSQVEFWKPIQGFDGYDVSSFGRVRSWRSPNGRKVPLVLTQQVSRVGYPIVGMYRYADGKRVIKFIHRLVAEAFCLKPENGAVVNHLTNVRKDARADGLEWTTHAGNMRHARKNGLFDKGKEAIALAKAQKARWVVRSIPDVMVKAIRNMAADNVPHSKIRKWTEVSGAQVEHIIYRTRYKDVA